RAVNNRYLKVTVRGSDPYPMFEAELEKVVRRHIRRGTLLVQIRVERPGQTGDLKLNAAALKAYVQQIRDVCEEVGEPEYAAPLRGGAPVAPGVAEDAVHCGAPQEHGAPGVKRTLEAALRRPAVMRKKEGRAMPTALLHPNRHIKDQLELIRQHL